MTVASMRDYISKMYDSDKWRLRVHGMEDNQVIAIYKTMQQRGQKPPKKHKKDIQVQQITIFDLLGGKQNA